MTLKESKETAAAAQLSIQSPEGEFKLREHIML
jgi:hypothetical protein